MTYNVPTPWRKNALYFLSTRSPAPLVWVSSTIGTPLTTHYQRVQKDIKIWFMFGPHRVCRLTFRFLNVLRLHVSKNQWGVVPMLQRKRMCVGWCAKFIRSPMGLLYRNLVLWGPKRITFRNSTLTRNSICIWVLFIAVTQNIAKIYNELHIGT